MSLESRIRLSDSVIEEVFLKLGEVRPMWHAFTEDGLQLIIEHPLIIDKDLAVAMIKKLFAEKQVVEALFISEAWTATLEKGTSEAELDHWNRAGLKSHPNRLEVIMYQAENAEAACSAHREIIRNRQGKGRLGPLIIHDDTRISEGRLIGIIPRRGSVH